MPGKSSDVMGRFRRWKQGEAQPVHQPAKMRFGLLQEGKLALHAAPAVLLLPAGVIQNI